MDAARIGAMKPDACLLNLARGEVADLDALDAALTLAASPAMRLTHTRRSHPTQRIQSSGTRRSFSCRIQAGTR